MEISFDHFKETLSIVFQELKEELELQDKTIFFEVSNEKASITISDGEKQELEYKLRAVKIEGDGEKEGEEVIMNVIQYLNVDGKIVRKEAIIIHKDGSPVEPDWITREMIINDMLNKYRSSNPFAKIVMSPYSDFYK